MMKQNNNEQKIEVWEKPLHLVGSFENPLTLESIEKAFRDLNMPKLDFRRKRILIYGGIFNDIVAFRELEEDKGMVPQTNK